MSVSSSDRTDTSKWRLRVKHGRQTWYFDDEADRDTKQSVVEKYWLGTLTDTDLPEALFKSVKPETAREAAKQGMRFFELLLTEDGHWAGEYGGPLFLLAGIAVVYHITGQKLEEAQRVEIIRYCKNTVGAEGGWGLHIEGHSIMLCTVLNYVVMRLLGVSPNDPVCVQARAFIQEHGGAITVPSWGKFWLSCLNVYHWDGVNALLPELWLLPYAAPIHPARLWCHARQIYLPMSYCYGRRLVAQETELIYQLRRELYCQPYEEIDWVGARDAVADVDVYAPHHKLLDLSNWVQNTFESFHSTSLRERAFDEVWRQIKYDDDNTDFISIGPISKMIQMLVVWHIEGPESPRFQGHLDRVRDYLWIGPDGMRMQGTNGSQLWDTAFAACAMVEGGLASDPEFKQTATRVLEFLDDMQVKKPMTHADLCYRDNNEGGFPFSTLECGWIVSDCTAEGLKAVLYMQQMEGVLPRLIPDDRIFKSVDLLLSMQNDDGGFASYEKRRGSTWLEVFNPSEVFGEIMVDYSYVECTSSVLQVLSKVRKMYPHYRSRDIEACFKSAYGFILGEQRQDGSWFGSWGVCFTYAMWFALEALACFGETYETSESVRRACDWLVSKQREDGGWGESYLACTEKVYVQHETSQVVNTSWEILALLAAKYPVKERMQRACQLLMARQTLAGEWKQEGIEGVFNKTCMISYPNYKFIFPIWALGRYANTYEQ